MDRYAVIGQPIAHSVSPALHASFARQTGERLVYERLETSPAAFRDSVDAFFAAGGKGLNVTLPFKREACSRAAELTPRARDAGAVNTLWYAHKDRLRGDNTDGAGFIRDLTGNRGFNLARQRVLLLGAGGAARGLLGPLVAQQPARVHIANRTGTRARALAATSDNRVSGGDLADWPDEQYDLVINATAAGHAGSLALPPPGLLAADCAWYDLGYGSAAAPFLEWARRQDVQFAADGWGMLVEQAAESFYLWRGVRPGTAGIIAARDRYLPGS